MPDRMTSHEIQPTSRRLANREAAGSSVLAASLSRRQWVAPAITLLLSASALPAYMNQWPSGGIPALARPRRQR